MAFPAFDTWAPAQFVTAYQSNVGNTQTGSAQVASNQSQTYDGTIAYKMAGTVISALVLVFILQRLGFRFVVSASTGVGR